MSSTLKLGPISCRSHASRPSTGSSSALANVTTMTGASASSGVSGNRSLAASGERAASPVCR
jgi:hypothetical protein